MTKLLLSIRILWLILGFVCFTHCSSSSSTTTSDATSDLEDDSWRAVTNAGDILMGIEFSGVSATLTVVNNSEETLDAPSLTTYDLSTGEASLLTSENASSIEAAGSYQGSFTFPGSSTPEDETLISVSFGDEQAAIFFVAETYSLLSPAYFDPALSSYIVPSSGTWDFSMQLGTEFLTGSECPDSSGSFTTEGEAILSVSENALSAMWFVDDALVTFNRSAVSQTFESPNYSFQVESDEETVYGTNQWNITPSSATSITGILEWDNSLGCTAQYPITMEFQSSSTFSPVILCEGTWTITYDPIVCGPNVISSTFLPSLPNGSGTLDVTYALDTPVNLSFDSFSSYQSLPNVGGTNMYGTGLSSMVLGTTVDILGSPLIVVGGMQMIAIDTTTIQGILNITGFGLTPCSGTSTFTLTSVSGC